MATLTFSGTLVVTSCWCGIRMALPDSLEQQARHEGKNHAGIHCPLGHTFIYPGETEATKLKRQLEYARDSLARERARADGAEASLRTTKGHVTRLRKRVIEGECPFCGQHLRDLARHVGRVHPDEVPDAPTV